MFQSGEVLVGRYEVISYHAAGGMQEVYVGFDRALSRKVAIKTPKIGPADRRFKRGAEMGARTNHPNIAATFDYYESNDTIFMVEEFIDGVNLAEHFRRGYNYLDPLLAAHVVHHVLRALAEAHKMGICHRDLKPSNIMTSADAGFTQIKLTDFGIAKLAEAAIDAEMKLFDEDESTLTTSDTLLGAVPYMAPECWVSWKDAGQEMDIWALGCIAYELLVGHPPFGTGKRAIGEVVRLNGNDPSLKIPEWFGKHEFTVDLERSLWGFIVKCLKADPAHRSTAAELLEYFNSVCYSSAPRNYGIVDRYPHRYMNGGVGDFGFIKDASVDMMLFFHQSVYFGQAKPRQGVRVNYSYYPGVPQARCCPVLELK